MSHRPHIEPYNSLAHRRTPNSIALHLALLVSLLGVSTSIPVEAATTDGVDGLEGVEGVDDDLVVPAERGAGEPARARRVIDEVVEEVVEEVSEKPEPIRAGVTRARSSWEHSAGLLVGTGPLRLKSAFLPPSGWITFGLYGELLSGADVVEVGDSIDRITGRVTMNLVPLSFLELSAGLRTSGITNTMTDPEFKLSAGDLDLGLFLGGDIRPWIAAVAGARLSVNNNLGGIGLSRESASLWSGVALSLDARQIGGSRSSVDAGGVPVRFHVNAGYLLDNSSAQFDTELTLGEQFAHSVNKFDMATIGAGLEVAPLAWLGLFTEYHLHLPVETRSTTLDVCVPDLPCPGDPAVGMSSYPQWISTGFKASPGNGFTFSAAVDLGLTRTVAYGVTPSPPLNFIAGLSYSIDPRPPVRVVNVTRTLKKTVLVGEEPPSGIITGKVVDSATREGIGGAIIHYRHEELADHTSQATATDGSFTSYAFPEGPLVVEVLVPGAVEPVRFKVDMPAQGAVQRAFPVERERPPVLVEGEVRGAEDEPISSGTVMVLHESLREELRLDGEGRFRGAVPHGTIRVQVVSDGYLAVEREVTARHGDRVVLDFNLARALAPAVEVTEREILLKQPIHFEPASSIIVRDSFHILDQVVDVMVRNLVGRVRIEGHTDSVGGEEMNLRLSQDRAEAVRQYLVGSGISSERVEARGYGLNRPVAPNATPEGRAMNRRVEFIVIE